MFDPVANHARQIRFNKLRDDELIKSNKLGICNMCGKKSKKLFNGRCILCETRMAQAIFHHSIPDSKLDKKRPYKKINAPHEKKIC